MAGYKYIREAYDLTKTITGKTGTKVFLDYANGVEDLPELGDPFGVLDKALKCVSIKETPNHFEEGICKRKYVCNYSTDTVINTNANQFIHNGGSEMISVDDPKEWFWVPTFGAPTTGLYKGKLYKNTIRGSISKAIFVGVAADEGGGSPFQTYLEGQVYPKLGKINKTDFKLANVTYNKGTLLFPNYNAILITDELGTEKMQVTLNFAYRILQIGDVNVDYSWDYYLFPDKVTSPGHPEWQLVTNEKENPNIDTDFIYKTAEFDGLLI